MDCMTCGAPLRDGARFCRGCGTAVAGTAASSTAETKARAAAAMAPPPAAPTLPLPPATSPAPPPAPAARNTTLVLGAVAAAVVLLVGGLVLLTSGGEDDTTATAASADGEGEPAPETEDDAADDADGSDEDGDQATFDPDAGDDEPVETFEPTGTATTGARWVAILGSYPDAATAEGRRSQLAGTFPQHEFQVLQSADWATLNPGYHVPYHDGGFGSGEDAIAFCRSLGYSTRDQCYARFLSTDASAAQTQYPD